MFLSAPESFPVDWFRFLPDSFHIRQFASKEPLAALVEYEPPAFGHIVCCRSVPVGHESEYCTMT